jgi:adenylate cyclase
VMVTAKDQSEDVVEALGLGANDYVVKPLDFQVVLARVATQLSLKRAMAEIRRLAEKLEMRSRFIRQTFGRYLSDEVVAGLLERPEGLELGGEKRTVTLLMSDLRGFTALADRLSPEQVVRLLNNYLAGMSEVILRHQGTIDEFVGDAIMALFGAPVARPDDTERAAACAVAMQLAMADVNEKNRADGLPEVEMGVALNTGEVIVGNIGSEMRAKYGVVGINVNLTSRIQSFTLGGQVLVSESTVRSAGHVLRVGDPVTLHPKGFHQPVRVYELQGINGQHNLFLPEHPDELMPLSREIPISFRTLHGEHRQGPPRAGRLVKASERGALLRAARSLAPLSNLRIRLAGPDSTPALGEIYAKVLGSASSEPGTVRIRFTSSAPEIQRLIQSRLIATSV